MKRILILICLLTFSLTLNAQYVFTKIWDKTYGGPNFDDGGSLSAFSWFQSSNKFTPIMHNYILGNGNIIIAGSTRSIAGGDKIQTTKGNNDWTDAWVVCIDSSTGTKLWDKDFGSFNYEYFSDISPFGRNYLLSFNNDGNSASGDFTLAPPNNTSRPLRYLLLDSAFNRIEDRLWFGDGVNINPKFVSNNNHYTIAFSSSDLGTSNFIDTVCVSNINGFSPAILVFDSTGNKLKDKSYGQGNINGFQYMQDIISVPDGYIFCTYGNAKIGCSVSDSTLNNDIIIYRVDSTGQVLWQRAFGGGLNEITTGKILKTKDGNFMLTCLSTSFFGEEVSQPRPDPLNTDPNNYSLWNLKFNGAGSIIWDKRFGSCHTVSQFATSINTHDGGFLLGTTIGERGFFQQYAGEDSLPGCDVTESGRGQADFWLVKLDSLGNKEWDKRWGGSERDGLYDLAQLADDSYLVTGTSFSNISGDKSEDNRDTSHVFAGWRSIPSSTDYWVIRFRADKLVGIEEETFENVHLQIKPNPVKDFCTIEAKNIVDATLTLYDITGRVILNKPFNLKTDLDLSKLEGGVYVVQLKTKKGSVASYKIVKSN
jgi:hypothetical protein